MALQKALSTLNILAGFRATRIWLLNLERMEAKMDSSRPFYNIPSCKVIVQEIMCEDLPREEVDALHYYIEEEGLVSDEECADL